MFNLIPSGSITDVPGFSSGAMHAGIKSTGELDLALLLSRVPCVAAGVFTRNQVKSASVILSREHLATACAQAIVVNSGCANACVGEGGMVNAVEIVELVAAKLRISPDDVLLASTGVIGSPLPMVCVRRGIEQIVLKESGGHDMARAMMTTDTVAKEVSLQVRMGGVDITVAGVAKGVGMIHPDMATMLCFVATDALVDADFLQEALKRAAAISFNMISVDGDTSTNDCVFLLANGLAGGESINSHNGGVFQKALNEVCVHLAKSMVRDGEGATRLIEVAVKGAVSQEEARCAARAVASSLLVKAAVHGSDPNWGRVVAALGRSGAQVKESKLGICLNDVCLMKEGNAVPFNAEKLKLSLENSDCVVINAELGLGNSGAMAWGCDLSEEYATINSAYTT